MVENLPNFSRVSHLSAELTSKLLDSLDSIDESNLVLSPLVVAFILGILHEGSEVKWNVRVTMDFLKEVYVKRSLWSN